MARIMVEPRAILPDGSIMCCDDPAVGSDDVCANCHSIHVWDANGVHFEIDVPVTGRTP